MVQYGVLMDEDLRNGISVFGQVSLPTGSIEKNRYKGLFGISYQLAFGDIMRLNGNVHYDPKEEMAEYEDKYVGETSPRPVIALDRRPHRNQPDAPYHNGEEGDNIRRRPDRWNETRPGSPAGQG